MLKIILIQNNKPTVVTKSTSLHTKYSQTVEMEQGANSKHIEET